MPVHDFLEKAAPIDLSQRGFFAKIPDQGIGGILEDGQFRIGAFPIGPMQGPGKFPPQNLDLGLHEDLGRKGQDQWSIQRPPQKGTDEMALPRTDRRIEKDEA